MAVSSAGWVARAVVSGVVVALFVIEGYRHRRLGMLCVLGRLICGFEMWWPLVVFRGGRGAVPRGVVPIRLISFLVALWPHFVYNGIRLGGGGAVSCAGWGVWAVVSGVVNLWLPFLLSRGIGIGGW